MRVPHRIQLVVGDFATPPGEHRRTFATSVAEHIAAKNEREAGADGERQHADDPHRDRDHLLVLPEKAHMPTGHCKSLRLTQKRADRLTVAPWCDYSLGTQQERLWLSCE